MKTPLQTIIELVANILIIIVSLFMFVVLYHLSERANKSEGTVVAPLEQTIDQVNYKIK